MTGYTESHWELQSEIIRICESYHICMNYRGYTEIYRDCRPGRYAIPVMYFYPKIKEPLHGAAGGGGGGGWMARLGAPPLFL